MPAKCNWCQDELPHGTHLKYCSLCARCCVKECTTCHKPYPNLKYFQHHDHICNSCHKKHINRATKSKK